MQNIAVPQLSYRWCSATSSQLAWIPLQAAAILSQFRTATGSESQNTSDR